MFPGGLFNNPWHSWRSTNQLEDTQTIPEYDLFDDDMTSTSNPCNRSGGTTTPTQSQLDTLPHATSAQPSAPAPVAPSDPESEYDLNVWRLHAPSHHNTPEPEHFSSPNAVPLLTSKCRYKEVDFSQSLRRGLYEKEEVIQKLRKRIREQGWVCLLIKDTFSATDNNKQNDAVTSLQSLVKERERELSALHEAFSIQSGQEQTAQQYEKQLNELCKQFESSMQSHIDKLQTTRMAEIETRVQDEVTRLSSTLQAQKERELANIEQRYARLKKPMQLSGLGEAEEFRNEHGSSELTLILMLVQDNPADPADPAGFTSERHEAETGEKAAPGSQDDQPTSPPVSAMVEAITKSVETTLRTLLESGGDFSVGTILRSPRRTPRRKKQENHKLQLEKATEPNYHHDFILAEVRRLFKEKLGIVQDIDFITHAPASAADVHAYEYEDGPSPDTDKIAFDLARNYSSPWNTFLLSFLLREFQLRCASEAWPIRKEDDYVEEILWERYKRLRTLWRNAQPKLTTKGVPETPAEHEARLVEDSQRLGKESRQATCRRNHGMSSEESSVENGIKNVLRVKKLEWRRNIDKELEIVDLQRVLDKDIFCSQGSKPLPRKRAPDNPISSRVPVVGLPMALYDDMWILQLMERWRESLEISKVPFPWMKLVAT
ncbi:hypothetical protein F5141DRAFT_1064500 [Pisolithus sp. B1]|nr:hypothetical protein F5141DRAFT_1064500 [Pisolithus sp. B1]